jgi:hypothetical protein
MLSDETLAIWYMHIISIPNIKAASKNLIFFLKNSDANSANPKTGININISLSSTKIQPEAPEK